MVSKNAAYPMQTLMLVGGGVAVLILFVLLFLGRLNPIRYDAAAALLAASSTPSTQVPVLDTHAYDLKLLKLAHTATSSPWYQYFLTGTTTATTTWKKGDWPVKAVYPKPGALLPFNRIVAYYGNFYSTAMGVLGQTPPEVMIPKLKAAVAEWEAADPTTPVIPAIDYIALTAQASPGADGMYRFRMPEDQVQKAIDLADQVHGIVILDIQVGKSTIQTELPLLAKYLALPNVHLALDPEFSMKSGAKPGTEIGTFSSSDINYTMNVLAQLVNEHDLPPKILVIHRFTRGMVTGYQNIKLLPEVQIVMDMDGWGSPAKKQSTYRSFIAGEPIQFTGFKLFYKNDVRAPSPRMMTPEEVLQLTPAPSFIQYQ